MDQLSCNLDDESAATYTPSSNNEINLLELVLMLAKHWKMIVGIPFVVAILTTICTLFIPNIYTAKTMIIPGDNINGGMMGAMMAQVGSLAGLAGGMGGSVSKTDLYVTMLNSDTLKDPIIDRYKLMELYEAKYRVNAYAAMDDSSTVRAGKKDGVITIAVDNTDPILAAAIANAYVEELGRLAAKLSMTGAGINRVFIEDRLAKANAQLALAEDSLKSFQNRNKAVAVTDQAKTTLEGVAALRAQLVSQEVQLAVLQQQFSAESREVKSTRTTMESLRTQISRLEGSDVEGSMPGVGSMPQLGQEYMRLMREFKIQETLVELLTKQYEMTKLDEAKDIAPFQVLQTAKVPDLKSKPRRSLIVIIAAFVSGFLVTLIALVREFGARMSDEDLRRWRELQRLLPLPRKYNRQDR